jgi:chitodextrinase
MTSASYTTDNNDAGSHTVTVTVSDGSLTDTQNVTVTVTDVNVAPVLDTIADITVNEGDTVTISPTATDPDGDTLTYTYSGWMSSSSYTTNSNDVGTHTVTVTVSDGTLTDSQDVIITVNNVNQAPVLDTIADITVNEGDTITLNPTATDPDGDALTYTYSGWMTSASYTTDNNDAGSHTVTVTVSDGSLTDSQDVTVTVSNTNRPPVLNPIADITANEGDTVTLNPTATDPDGDALTYTYSGWMTSASYTTDNNDAGSHTVTVAVSDGSLTDSQDVTVIVNDVDTTAPSTPDNLQATAVSASQIDLSWNASTDDVGVTGYRIYRDGTLITTTANTTYQDTGLSASTTYTYTVSAFDAAGNESYQSLLASATTTEPLPTQTVTIINVGDTWKYFKGYSNPGTGWDDVSYDDSSWLAGPTGIGYGDGDDATILSDMKNNYLTVYTRKEFNINDPSSITSMTLTMDYDDGFVAYINGQEVARANMPGGTPDYDTKATSHEAGTPVEFDLISYIGNLVTGTNVLSIEIHNRSINSSDLSMLPELEVESTDIGGGPSDTTAPSTPDNLQATAVSAS